MNWAHVHLLVKHVPSLGGAFSRPLLIAVLVTSAVSAGALGWTGLAGGRINHPEVQAPGDREHGPARPH